MKIIVPGSNAERKQGLLAAEKKKIAVVGSEQRNKILGEILSQSLVGGGLLSPQHRDSHSTPAGSSHCK